MSKNSTITSGLKKLKLAGKVEAKTPPKDDLAKTDAWVDDEFDANQLLQDCNQQVADDDEWEDTASEEDVVLKVKKNEVDNWRKTTHLPDYSNKDKPKYNFRDNCKDKLKNYHNHRDKHIDNYDHRDKPRVKYSNTYRDNHTGSHKDDALYRNQKDYGNTKDNTDTLKNNALFKRLDVIEEPKKLGEKTDHMLFSKQRRNNSAKLKPIAAEELESIRKSNDISRLMSVARWKETKYVYGDGFSVDEIKEDVPTLLNKHSKNNKQKKTNSKGADENSGLEHSKVFRIHYVDDKPVQKKVLPLKSRWADDNNDDDEKKSHHIEPVQDSRDFYRKQKIASQLDWDKGIQCLSDHEKVSFEDDTPLKPKIDHTHFTYDNSNVEETKLTPKAETKSKARPLASRWA